MTHASDLPRDLLTLRPDTRVAVRDLFGLDSNLTVPAFSQREDHVPEVDPAYRFNPDVTLAILAGFAQDRRVMVQGLHGSAGFPALRRARAAPTMDRRPRDTAGEAPWIHAPGALRCWPVSAGPWWRWPSRASSRN